MSDKDNLDLNIEKELKQLEKVIPAMNVTVPSSPKAERDDLIPDTVLLGLYGELLDMTRQDRVETTEYINNLAEMVFNGGDGSSSSKESLVQLMKLKMDATNNMSKIADLMTRIKLKDRYTIDFAPLNASQTNNINIKAGNQKKELMGLLKTKKTKEAPNEK